MATLTPAQEKRFTELLNKGWQCRNAAEEAELEELSQTVDADYNVTTAFDNIFTGFIKPFGAK